MTSLALLETSSFAAEKHRDQRRKDAFSAPYINHPLEVSRLLAAAGVEDLAILQAALLHDTVEDTKTTFEELEQKFGVSVTNIVKEVTDDKSLPKDQRKRLQIEHARHGSLGCKLVKLGDKLHNLSSLLVSPPAGWEPERIQGYFVWSKQVVDAIRGTNATLEGQLDEVFSSSFTAQGKTWPCLPEGNHEKFLEAYYASMKRKDD